MAINVRHIGIIELTFREINPEANIRKEGPKEDGGYESVSMNVEELKSQQFQALAELDNKVPNSLLVKRSGTGVKVMFY